MIVSQNLKTLVNFNMKKNLFYFLLLVFLAGNVSAQDKKANIDYQYIRSNNDYTAYTLFVVSSQTLKTVELELVSTFVLDELTEISIKKGSSYIKLTPTAKKVKLENDNKNLNGLLVSADFDRVLKAKIDCETSITFSFSNGKKVELPFMFCLLKEKLAAN